MVKTRKLRLLSPLLRGGGKEKGSDVFLNLPKERGVKSRKIKATFFTNFVLSSWMKGEKRKGEEGIRPTALRGACGQEPEEEEKGGRG